MPTEIVKVDKSELVPLRPKELLTLLAMLETNTDAEAIAKCPYSESQYYRLKPKLEKYKSQYLTAQVDKAAGIIKANAPKAAMELAKELNERTPQMRNKAANDILDKALPKQKSDGPNVQVNVQNVIGKQKESYKLDE